MTEWTEINERGERIRYRPRNGAGSPGQMYELEYWHDRRQEWRAVRSLSSRDHFALGIAAGLEIARRGVQEELFG